MGEVFVVFLGLGLTSFGGPVAHLGYFRTALVQRRQWLGERAYADLVALCQFLPGPASSQVAMAIGLQRSGLWGLLAAWAGFTLPSALLMVGFAYGLINLDALAQAGWVNGLKAAAVAVVANAVVGMARVLTPDWRRAALALAAMLALITVSTPWTQVAVIVIAGSAGLAWLRPGPADHEEAVAAPLSRTSAALSLSVFAVLLALLPMLAAATADPALRMADSFYRSGSLVFGGGHVVLPLLDAETAQRGLLSNDTFLAGYGAAQALPGPLFTFAAFLGYAQVTPPNGPAGAALALVAIFLPSALLIAGALPFWERLRRSRRARAALMGVNAAVVGMLAAALYAPVVTTGITGPITLTIAATGFIALTWGRVPAWSVVLASAIAGALLT